MNGGTLRSNPEIDDQDSHIGTVKSYLNFSPEAKQ